MPPRYPLLPARVVLPAAWAVVRGNQRSFHRDAQQCILKLPLEVEGHSNIPQAGPTVIVMNHYCRPGFQAYWFSLAISALIPVEIHWTMTSAWTDDGTPGAALRAWISPVIFPRIARIYNFTSMPPMPPRPFEVEARARAVRQLLAAARQQPPPVLALAPEGQDNPAGGLMHPHPGVGRLLSHLDGMGYSMTPVGVFEDDRFLRLCFGVPFTLALPGGVPPVERDRLAADQVMRAIANLLPAELHGDYKPN